MSLLIMYVVFSMIISFMMNFIEASYNTSAYTLFDTLWNFVVMAIVWPLVFATMVYDSFLNMLDI